MIRRVGERIGRAVLDGIGRAASRVQERKSLPVDLLESDAAFLAVFDAPGVAAEEVSVRFQDNTLQVHVTRAREFDGEYDLRFPGRGLALSGRIELPEDADVAADAADATLTDSGTLEVLIPKSGHEDGTGASTTSEETGTTEGAATTSTDGTASV